MFGFTATLIILSALLIISFLILFESKLTIDTLCFWRRFRKDADLEDDGEDEEEEVDVEITKQEKIAEAKEEDSTAPSPSLTNEGKRENLVV